MNSSKSWIKAYVPELSCTDQEFFDAMTLSGTKDLNPTFALTETAALSAALKAAYVHLS